MSFSYTILFATLFFYSFESAIILSKQGISQSFHILLPSLHHLRILQFVFECLGLIDISKNTLILIMFFLTVVNELIHLLLENLLLSNSLKKG